MTSRCANKSFTIEGSLKSQALELSVRFLLGEVGGSLGTSVVLEDPEGGASVVVGDPGGWMR